MLLGQIPFTLPSAVKTCHQINRYRQISTSKEKNFNMKSAGNAKIRMEEVSPYPHAEAELAQLLEAYPTTCQRYFPEK